MTFNSWLCACFFGLRERKNSENVCRLGNEHFKAKFLKICIFSVRDRFSKIAGISTIYTKTEIFLSYVFPIVTVRYGSVTVGTWVPRSIVWRALWGVCRPAPRTPPACRWRRSPCRSSLSAWRACRHAGSDSSRRACCWTAAGAGCCQIKK